MANAACPSRGRRRFFICLMDPFPAIPAVHSWMAVPLSLTLIAGGVCEGSRIWILSFGRAGDRRVIYARLRHALAACGVQLLKELFLFFGPFHLAQAAISVGKKAVNSIVIGVRLSHNLKFTDRFLDPVSHHQRASERAMGIPNSGIQRDRSFQKRDGFVRLPQADVNIP